MGPEVKPSMAQHRAHARWVVQPLIEWDVDDRVGSAIARSPVVDVGVREWVARDADRNAPLISEEAEHVLRPLDVRVRDAQDNLNQATPSGRSYVIDTRMQMIVLDLEARVNSPVRIGTTLRASQPRTPSGPRARTRVHHDDEEQAGENEESPRSA